MSYAFKGVVAVAALVLYSYAERIMQGSGVGVSALVVVALRAWWLALPLVSLRAWSLPPPAWMCRLSSGKCLSTHAVDSLR